MLKQNWTCLRIVTARVRKHNSVRWLVLGPDRTGNLLELVVMDRPAGGLHLVPRSRRRAAGEYPIQSGHMLLADP